MTDERDTRPEGMGGHDAQPTGMGERDPAVGDLLRTARVPDHRGDYWEALEARLDAEGRRKAAPEADRAPGTDRAPEADRAPAVSRRRRATRRWWRPVLVTAAAAGVCALVAFGLPGLKSSQPEPATAADVIARAVKAIDDLQTISGVMVERSALGGDPAKGFTETSTRFWLDDAGDWAQTGATEGPETWGEGTRTLAFDAATARLVEVKEWAKGGTPTYTEWNDAPIGAPDGAVFEALRSRAFARVVDAFRDAKLADTSHDGRAAWRLTSVRASGERWPAKADRIELVVDEATAMPVRWTLFREGDAVAEQRIDELVVNEPIDASRFAPAAPVDASRKAHDAGYRRLDAAEVAAGLPFATFFPAHVPAGFVPRSAALARREWRDPEAGMQWEALALPAALFSWRRGFDELSVSTRPYARSVVYEGDDVAPRVVEDPFESTYAWMFMRTQARDVTLRSGALSGLEAHVVAGAWVYPHLWVVVPTSLGRDKLIVTVAGDATADELVSVAESLAPLQPAAE